MAAKGSSPRTVSDKWKMKTGSVAPGRYFTLFSWMEPAL